MGGRVSVDGVVFAETVYSASVCAEVEGIDPEVSPLAMGLRTFGV